MPRVLTSDSRRPMCTSVTTDVLRRAPVRHQHAHRAAVRLAGVIALVWGDLAKTPQAPRGDVVVMQSWEYPQIPALRRKHPGITILMYKDASAVVKEAESATGRYPAGMGYDWVAAEHPSWFLRDRSGQQLEWSDWRGLYPMDVA